MHKPTKIKILCVCRGDVLRGPMMQARLQSLLDKSRFKVESAGFERRSLGRHQVHPSVVTCMQKRGIDVSKHKSHYISKMQHLDEYSAFVCVSQDVAQRVRDLLATIGHNALVIGANDIEGGISDPHEAADSVEACASLIDKISPAIADQVRAYVETWNDQ